jgi:membrane-anchored protein YejM (alkaline phosphatase superfamily)
MDLTATLMPLLGVQNPVSDYSFGFNLLEKPARDYTILADWDRLAYIDDDVKITVPISANAGFRQRITDYNDNEIVDPSGILQIKNPVVIKMMKDVGRFYRTKAANEKNQP